MKGNKKASYSDVFFMAFIALVCALTFITGWFIFEQVNTQIQAGDHMATEGKAIMTSLNNRYVSLFDGLFLTVVVVVWLTAIVLAFMINSHPIFYFLSFFVYLVLIIIAAAFGNVFYEFTQDSTISTAAAAFPIINLVMGNFVIFCLVVGFSVGLVMYAKSRQGYGY